METESHMKLELIRMQSNTVYCSLCGLVTELRWGVPTFNGDVVSNGFPEDLFREHGGSIPVCNHCYDEHAAGRVTVYDRYYVPRNVMGVDLVDGGGI